MESYQSKKRFIGFDFAVHMFATCTQDDIIQKQFLC